MNATPWHTVGHSGAGVKVGIIDAGFIGYSGLLGSDLPASITRKNFVDGETDAQVGSTTEHGTACAEIIHDVAPDAQLYLVKIATNVDLAEAVNYLIGQNVDIISTSLGFYNLTPGDSTGEFANLVTQAKNAGILWLTAAGNDREAHWGGLYSDPDGDNFHNFNGTQEINYFGPGDGSAYLVNSGFVFTVFVRWNDWTNVNQDYDLHLVRWNGSAWNIIASSTNFQNGGSGQTPTEFAFGITSGSAAPYGFIIERWNSTQTVNFEIFVPKFLRPDEIVNARSLANLADAPNAMTVAALDVDSPYPQESYSSEGPTNGPGGARTGGAIKPDISGYANVSTESYGPGGFNGTSAATPHVAGAAALVQGAFLSNTPTQLRTFLEGQAIDIGSSGKDTRFGYGRLHLGPAPPMPEPLAAPVLTVTSVSASQIDLSWTDDNTDEDGFKVERSLNKTNWNQIATVGMNVTTYANTGLECGTTYHYRVRAYNTSGNSAYSNLGTATTFACSYDVFLPLVLKSFTSPLPTSGPKPGFWESNTGEEFYVTSNSAQVDDFAIFITVSGCGSYKITRTSPVPITNNQFSFTGSYYASGTFNSTITANGTVGLDKYSIFGCGLVSGGPFSWNATWKNSSQPTLLPATIVDPEIVQPITATTKAYVVTRVE